MFDSGAVLSSSSVLGLRCGYSRANRGQTIPWSMVLTSHFFIQGQAIVIFSWLLWVSLTTQWSLSSHVRSLSGSSSVGSSVPDLSYTWALLHDQGPFCGKQVLAFRCSLSWHSGPASYSLWDLGTGHHSTVPHSSPLLSSATREVSHLPSCILLPLFVSLSPFLFYFAFFTPSSHSGDRERVFYLAEVRLVVCPITNPEHRYPKSKVREAGITPASSKLWSSWKNWDSQGAFLELRVQSASSSGCY